MNKNNFFRLLIARAVDYAFWLFTLTLIEEQSSLYLSSFLLMALAPIMMMVFGTLSAKYFKTTLGLRLMRIGMTPPVSFKEAFKAALPWTRPEKLEIQPVIPRWRFIVATAIGIGAILLQFNDPVYGFSSHGSIKNSSWVQYTHEAKGFSVYFPDQPKETQKPLTPNGESNLKYTEMSSKENRGLYSLSYLKMPRKWGLAGDNTILKVSLDLIVKNTKGATLEKREMTNYHGLKAIDYTLKVDNKEIRGRLLVHKNMLYKLNVEYPKGASSKVAAEDFIASFNIES